MGKAYGNAGGDPFIAAQETLSGRYDGLASGGSGNDLILPVGRGDTADGGSGSDTARRREKNATP